MARNLSITTTILAIVAIMVKQNANFVPKMFDTFFGPGVLVLAGENKDFDVAKTLSTIKDMGENGKATGKKAFPRLGNSSSQWVGGLVHMLSICNRQMQEGLIERLRDVCDSALSVAGSTKYLDKVRRLFAIIL